MARPVRNSSPSCVPAGLSREGMMQKPFLPEDAGIFKIAKIEAFSAPSSYRSGQNP
jgi:hypothetical protein